MKNGKKKSPRFRAGISLGIIEHQVPDGGKDDSNGKEDQPRHEDVAIAALLCLLELTGPVVGIQLMLFSAHGNEGQHHVAKNEADSDECPFAADEIHGGKERHQDTCDEEGICQNLQIDRRTLGEESLGPNHQEGDQHLNSGAYRVFD